MLQHPALTSGNVAVITGGADGIGLAAAHYFKSLGLEVCIADVNATKLEQASSELGEALALVADVSQLSDVERVREEAYGRYGRVDILMNNAGVAKHCGSWTEYEAWKQVIDINLWGVINGIHSFVPHMIKQGSPAVVINTCSKQGITAPPGNPAYNVSKAGVKAVSEALQHNLRNEEGCQVSAHLLVPGFTYTGMIKEFLPEKPESAWTSEQVVVFMAESLANGDFYILCPDNDATRAIDNKRMAWAMGDLIKNRPPLSRWHPDYQIEFEQFMQE